MILGNVIRNCLRQDSVNKVLFLRFISLSDGSQRVLRMTMVLPTFPERKVGQADGLLCNTMRTRQDTALFL